MKKLARHKYFVRLINGEINLCPIEKDGGIQMFAGQISWESLKYPIDADLVKDINETLGINLSNDKLQSRLKYGA